MFKNKMTSLRMAPVSAVKVTQMNGHDRYDDQPARFQQIYSTLAPLLPPERECRWVSRVLRKKMSECRCGPKKPRKGAPFFTSKFPCPRRLSDHLLYV